MKRFRNYALFWAIVLSVALAMELGSILLDRGLSRGETALEALMRYPETLRRMNNTMQTVAEPPTQPPTQPTMEPVTEPATEPATEPSMEPSTEPTEETAVQISGPLAVWGEDESYFDDALFIGDSRTDGLRLFSPLGNASYFCTTGMTIFDVFEETAPNRDLVEQTLVQVLEQRQFGKIYITLALNELAEKDIVLKAEFQMVLNHLKRMQPGAKLILHGIMPLGKEKSGSYDYF